MKCPLYLLIVFILYNCMSSTIPEEYEEVEIVEKSVAPKQRSAMSRETRWKKIKLGAHALSLDQNNRMPEEERVEKSVEPKQRSASGRVLTGNNCEYIKLCSVTANDGCTDGNKFVINQVKGVRKQFLILNGQAILGFVRNGKKFADCESYTEVTTNVDCKVVPGLIGVTLPVLFVCPGMPGWSKFEDFCYKVKNEGNYNLVSCNEECKDDGAFAASIHSKEENDFISKNLPFDKDMVLGGLAKNWTIPSDRQWIDGTPWDFDNIGAGDPDLDDDGDLMMWYGEFRGTWFTFVESWRSPFCLCKIFVAGKKQN